MNEEETYDHTLAANPDNHTAHQFCTDMDCPCHEDQDAVGQVNDFYEAGVISADDAHRIYRGQTV